MLCLSKENKVLVRRAFEEVWHKGNLEVLDEIMAPDVIVHIAPPGAPPTGESVKQMTVAILNAFSERQADLEDLIAEGDKVVERWRFSGKHTGEFMGLPPTHKQVTFSGISIMRIVGGKVVEEWDQVDALGMMQQLGLVPSPE